MVNLGAPAFGGGPPKLVFGRCSGQPRTDKAALDEGSIEDANMLTAFGRVMPTYEGLLLFLCGKDQRHLGE